MGDLIDGIRYMTRYQQRAEIKAMAGRGRKVVWMHPAFADRCVFAKNDQELVCVSLSK